LPGKPVKKRLFCHSVQGSVLGPLLFLVYINDMINVLDGRCSCKLYADDVKIYTTSSVDDDIVYFQSKLDALFAWSRIWQLNISSSKCASMVIGDSKAEPVLYLDINVINRVSEYKDLGVIIDNSLKFKSHINSIVAKANSRACLIHKCFVTRDIPTLVRAFKTYVRPLLEYASTVWSPSCVTSIESVQRKFTKRLLGCRQLDYATRLAKLDLQSLELR
jgi:ribonucleases P/MRP protein subunit RPP40